MKKHVTAHAARASALLLMGVVCCLTGAHGAAATATITWGPCPEQQGGTDCGILPVPLDRADEAKGTIDYFIRRFHSGKPTGDTVWMLDGGPGFSTNAFTPIAEYMIQMNPMVTVYLADQRGTGLSHIITCENPPTQPYFDPANATLVNQYRACNEDVVAKYGNISHLFSSYNAALDLLDGINAVGASRVALYAHSYGSYLANIYLNLPDARADVVVIDGPVPPNRWMLENNSPWVSQVAQDVINACVQHSEACAARLDSAGHIPHLVMDAIIDGSLPCVKHLPWLNQVTASYYAGFMTLNKNAHVLQGPFWWRLYRCSQLDVEQLNFYHQYKLSHDSVVPPPEYAYGLAATIGSSELYTYGATTDMTYEAQVARTARQFADASPQLVVSLARETLPLYNADPEVYRKFASPKVPVLISVGSLDPNTPHGLGLWYKMGLGENAFVVTVPFAAHGTLAYDAPCANSIILGMLFGFGNTKPDLSCLSDIPVPDFDGIQNATKALSLQYFGVELLWGDVLPPSPSPPSPGNSSDARIERLEIITAILAVVAAVLASSTLVLYRRQRRTGDSALSTPLLAK